MFPNNKQPTGKINSMILKKKKPVSIIYEKRTIT